MGQPPPSRDQALKIGKAGRGAFTVPLIVIVCLRRQAGARVRRLCGPAGAPPACELNGRVGVVVVGMIAVEDISTVVAAMPRVVAEIRIVPIVSHALIPIAAPVAPAPVRARQCANGHAGRERNRKAFSGRFGVLKFGVCTAAP